MTTDDFFRGLLAILKQKGLEEIETRDDRHHRHFAAAAKRLGEIGEDPRLRFVPSPYTGRYPELDEALVRLQRDGLLRAENPFYVRVKIALSDERATKILGFYSSDELALLRAAAEAYSDAPDAAPRSAAT